MRATLRHTTRKPSRILAAVGAAVLLGGFTAACGSDGDSSAASNDGDTTDTVVVEEAEDSDDTGEKNRKLLEGAIGGEDSVVCDFMDTETQTTGKMYIQGKQNFFLEAIAEEGEIKMLKDLDMLYMWGPGAEMAISIDTSMEDSGDEMLSPENLDNEDLAQDLSCKKYTGSMDIFKVPSDIEFMSLNDMFGAFGSGDFEEFPMEGFEDFDFGEGN